MEIKIKIKLSEYQEFELNEKEAKELLAVLKKLVGDDEKKIEIVPVVVPYERIPDPYYVPYAPPTTIPNYPNPFNPTWYCTCDSQTSGNFTINKITGGL